MTNILQCVLDRPQVTSAEFAPGWITWSTATTSA